MPGMVRMAVLAAAVPQEAVEASVPNGAKDSRHALSFLEPNDTITVAMTDAAIMATALPHSDRSFLSHEESIERAASTIYNGAQRNTPVCVARHGSPITASTAI